MAETKRLVLIDGHAMLYRAWFAFPQSLTKRDGTLINAVYGFTRILLSVIEEFHPEYLAVSFDVGKTFRHEMYKEYKAHREKMPEELKEQEPITYMVVRTLNIPVFTKEGYEADDVIGTLALQASAQKPSNKDLNTNDSLETLIVTGDKDTLQLVVDPTDHSGQVEVYMPGRGSKGPTIYDEAKVEEDLGVKPEQIPDLKGLMGDTSDNIPGIKGVGPKTAVSLLREFGTVEGVYEALTTDNKQPVRQVQDKQTTGLKPRLLQKLIEGKESAFESKKLATIVKDVPIELDLEAAEVKQYNKQQVIQLFEEMEFRSLIDKLPKDVFEASVQEALF